jgi:hypothetical protein
MWNGTRYLRTYGAVPQPTAPPRTKLFILNFHQFLVCTGKRKPTMFVIFLKGRGILGAESFVFQVATEKIKD